MSGNRRFVDTNILVYVPAADDVLGAIGIHQRTGISFRNAMIVRSAAEMSCDALYSEDLDTGQEYSGVLAENPFQPPAPDRAQ
jgi:predicted nucleic acid-binding protein